MNLFELPAPSGKEEHLDRLNPGREVRIERIVSRGHASPRDFWYDQESDEWVALLSGHARLAFADGRTVDLGPGDTLLIRARERHRVEATSEDPPCVWLAVHGRLC